MVNCEISKFLVVNKDNIFTAHLPSIHNVEVCELKKFIFLHVCRKLSREKRHNLEVLE